MRIIYYSLGVTRLSANYYGKERQIDLAEKDYHLNY